MRKPAEVGSGAVFEECKYLFPLLNIAGLVADQHPCGSAVYNIESMNGCDEWTQLCLKLVLSWWLEKKKVVTNYYTAGGADKIQFSRSFL